MRDTSEQSPKTAATQRELVKRLPDPIASLRARNRVLRMLEEIEREAEIAMRNSG